MSAQELSQWERYYYEENTYIPCISHALKEGKLLTKVLTVDDNLESHYHNSTNYNNQVYRDYSLINTCRIFKFKCLAMIEPFASACSVSLQNMDIFLTMQLSIEDQKYH